MKKKPPPQGARLTQYGAFSLAESYRKAGDAIGRDSSASRWSTNPRHLLYLVAIENYLRANLLKEGLSPSEVRDFGHNLSAMLALCVERGMPSDTQVAAVIDGATRENDYVRVRYDSDLQYLGEDGLHRIARNTNIRSLAAALMTIRTEVAKRVVPLLPLD